MIILKKVPKTSAFCDPEEGIDIYYAVIFFRHIDWDTASVKVLSDHGSVKSCNTDARSAVFVTTLNKTGGSGQLEITHETAVHGIRYLRGGRQLTPNCAKQESDQ